MEVISEMCCFFYSFNVDHLTLTGFFNNSVKKSSVAMLLTKKKALLAYYAEMIHFPGFIKWN